MAQSRPLWLTDSERKAALERYAEKEKSNYEKNIEEWRNDGTMFGAGAGIIFGAALFLTSTWASAGTFLLIPLGGYLGRKTAEVTFPCSSRQLYSCAKPILGDKELNEFLEEEKQVYRPAGK